MSDELHVVSLVTLFDAVHADGVAVCGVTGVAPVGEPEDHSVSDADPTLGPEQEAHTKKHFKQRDYQR